MSIREELKQKDNPDSPWAIRIIPMTRQDGGVVITRATEFLPSQIAEAEATMESQ